MGDANKESLTKDIEENLKKLTKKRVIKYLAVTGVIALAIIAIAHIIHSVTV